MKTTTPRTTHRFGKLAVVMVMGAGLLGAFAPAALAQDTSDTNSNGQPAASGRPHPQLTDAQKACLQQHGAQKPAEGTQPTDEQRQALRAAAQACGIQLPRRHHHPRLTDAQKACLEQHGVQKPQPGANGERPQPTAEQRAAFRAAAQDCGIQLPNRPNANNSGTDNSASSNTSTAS